MYTSRKSPRLSMFFLLAVVDAGEPEYHHGGAK
jgi:hypothetical protein